MTVLMQGEQIDSSLPTGRRVGATGLTGQCVGEERGFKTPTLLHMERSVLSKGHFHTVALAAVGSAALGWYEVSSPPLNSLAIASVSVAAASRGLPLLGVLLFSLLLGFLVCSSGCARLW